MSERGPAIFISYRGGDEVWAPDLVYTSLVGEFGAEAVFKAGFNLRAGELFPPVLEERAASCQVMLVCIGPRWLAPRSADGTRRLDDVDDWVRKEIEISLRNGNHVIPLLLGNLNDISVPAPEDVPADIAPLVERQAFRLEPGGRLRITLPDLAARLAELVPGLQRCGMDGSAVDMVVHQDASRIDGQMTAYRGRPIGGHIEIDQKIGHAGSGSQVIGYDGDATP